MTDDNIGANAAEQLRSFVERIERLWDDKEGIGADLREVYTEARGMGWDSKVLREVIRMRRQDPNSVREHQALLGLYKRALGMD